MTDVSKISANGLETAFRRGGTGEPLLYLRGQGYPGRWISLYDQLGTRFDVIVPDHPSFGDTGLPDDYLDFSDLVIHYAAFLDALGLGQVHLVGHGFGGWIAAEFAAAYPERVKSLTLVAPSGLRPDESEAMFDGYRLDAEQWLDRALGPLRARWIAPAGEHDDWAERTLADYKERIGVARFAWNPRYSLRLERRIARASALPSQVLVPQEDGLTAPSIARKYAELLGIGAPVTIDGDGYATQHLVVLQEPVQIADKVKELIATV